MKHRIGKIPLNEVPGLRVQPADTFSSRQ